MVRLICRMKRQQSLILFLKHGMKPQRKLRKIELRQREKKLERVLVGNVMMQLVFGMKMLEQKITRKIIMHLAEVILVVQVAEVILVVQVAERQILPVIIEHILPIWLMERIGMEVLQIKGK